MNSVYKSRRLKRQILAKWMFNRIPVVLCRCRCWTARRSHFQSTVQWKQVFRYVPTSCQRKWLSASEVRLAACSAFWAGIWRQTTTVSKIPKIIDAYITLYCFVAPYSALVQVSIDDRPTRGLQKCYISPIFPEAPVYGFAPTLA